MRSPAESRRSGTRPSAGHPIDGRVPVGYPERYRPEFLIVDRSYYSDSCYANQIGSRIVVGFDFAASGQVGVGVIRHFGHEGRRLP